MLESVLRFLLSGGLVVDTLPRLRPLVLLQLHRVAWLLTRTLLGVRLIDWRTTRVIDGHNTKEELPRKQWVGLVLVALVLPYQGESTVLIVVQAHEWLHCVDELGELEVMFDLSTVGCLNVDALLIEPNILAVAEVAERQVIVANEAKLLGLPAALDSP